MKFTRYALMAGLLAMGAGVSHAQVANGAAAPEFTLKDSKGQTHSLSDFKGKYVILEWVNHGCPFVKKHYDTGNMQDLQKKYTDKGMVWLTICSSAPGKQGHQTPEQWEKTYTAKKKASTAILLDEDGKVGKAYGAKVTPHMYIINPEGELIYQGAIDDDRSANKDKARTANNYVKAALKAAQAGEPIPNANNNPYGCSVKYP